MTADLLDQSLQIHEGTVTAVGADGHVAVDVPGADELRCRLLQTSDGPPLALAPGDRVLAAALPGGGAAFVLGRVALHTPGAVPAAVPTAVPAAEASARTVEIVMPAGVETVRIAGKRVRIAADEELVLECGGASVRIDRRGKVVVLGTDITSRARRLHKIKGASVAIN